MCGEQPGRAAPWPTSTGSSPRVRGTVFCQRRHQVQRRFIPACAGNRSSRRRSSAGYSVHPRVCGEQLRWSNYYYRETGSSPRVRGTDDDNSGIGDNARFIPACAGNSGAGATATTWDTVHPRVCGEQPISSRPSRATSGSSPRVRGTESPKAAGGIAGRFIPACAGNRGEGSGGKPIQAVHPRVCGEQSAILSAA